MSDHTKENAALETASQLLLDAIQETTGFVPSHLDNRPGAAILVAAHAVVAKLDSMETHHIDLMRELLERVISIASNPLMEIKPTEYESEVMYRALEKDYRDRLAQYGSLHLIAEGGLDIVPALQRFKKISGL